MMRRRSSRNSAKASCRRRASRTKSLRLCPVRRAKRASRRSRSRSNRMVRAEVFMSCNVIQAAPPNKRLQLAGVQPAEEIHSCGGGLRPAAETQAVRRQHSELLAGGTLGGNAFEHAADTDVLIDSWPVNPLPAANDLELPPLSRGGIRQSPRPCQGHTDRAAVGQPHRDQVVGHLDRLGEGFASYHSAHATPPRCVLGSLR